MVVRLISVADWVAHGVMADILAGNRWLEMKFCVFFARVLETGVFPCKRAVAFVAGTYVLLRAKSMFQAHVSSEVAFSVFPVETGCAERTEQRVEGCRTRGSRRR